ncbi:hypothetical protein FNV43_RR21190 [Rhamnella rubrinervis]|uniref:SMP-LTD domain-containing protein n=1 Tax=Rhamnella rubrinervis TaxID=2594499 RepID=A0A8K0E099_9ROSA|nr:hypothetical protein FNV43_RR21190 [Rhamnella rubrinervis]
MWWVIVFGVGFVVGVLAIVAVEALGVFVILNRLTRKIKQADDPNSSSSLSPSHLDPRHQSHDFASNKQGIVWVLESEKVPKNWLEKASREQKKKKEFVEVSPIKKHAKIKDQSLILTESDGFHTIINLKGCIVEAVSATSLSSRKWAKRFPIKLENKVATIYKKSKTVYIYLETSWEKESWCKALRLASCDDKNKLDWFANLHKDFRCYLTSLNVGYPAFMKPSVGFYTSEPVDRTHRNDGPSKVRLLWRKLAKKSSKVGVENKLTWTSSSVRDERKVNEKFRPGQDFVQPTSLVKTVSPADSTPLEDNLGAPSSSTLTHSSSQSHVSVTSDADSDERLGIDEGTLCWNLLISRLFFDAKTNSEMKRSIQARVQRTLSNMRIPSYLGEVICTDVDPGNLPPYIHSMRVLPMDMNEVWALEVDIEYSGGAVLGIETRLEVRELDPEKSIADSNPEANSVGDVSSDILEGFEYFGKQLNLDEETSDALEQKGEANPKPDGIKSTKSSMSASTYGSRWKSVINSIAKQVSEVPLSLAIRVTSLRGTLRLHIKPPPSDQLWFSFTSMPDIDFNLDSAVGDHKITSGQIALFLIGKLKAAINETLVLPNCEGVCIPWMLAEKNDWVPRKVAPFLWLNQESANDPIVNRELPNNRPCEEKPKTEAIREASSGHTQSKHQRLKNAQSIQQISESSDAASSSTNPSAKSRSALEESRIPLLENDEPHETEKHLTEEVSENQSAPRSSSMFDKLYDTVEEDEARPKRMGRKARMLDLGKKMGEKFEEKRRHIEEKSRHIVEKMRGPGDGQRI